jgi:hypothetical protein
MIAMRSESQAIPGVAWTWTQLGGLAGVVGVALFVIGILTQGDVPGVNDSAEDIRAWFDENGQSYLVGAYLISIGVIFGLLPLLGDFAERPGPGGKERFPSGRSSPSSAAFSFSS